ncbi:MAG: hypothetical protein HYY64_15000 [Candidatus Rokubacteria bacterium]|nr:hypothetical protein [Candidatus Rokubacteria bacterium]
MMKRVPVTVSLPPDLARNLHALRGTFELFTSVAILTETATTLQAKFQWSDEKVRQLLQAISKNGDGLEDSAAPASSRR